ncbi:AbiJ-NTD4 domain-containing protein [Mucisphaera calidilacus]|uniref:HEPN AbiJ-N-terminal domain-containing protein n=1 Tax=Mucisphaera calidilacus TaxID=2527982 RepID=A0A518BUI0_9BACT|nr:hypothetical protein [Mucisphaera calidilacus]QDU70645.1 hypothetical protein Pan265_04750 [Mucisphaera calidilacus]
MADSGERFSRRLGVRPRGDGPLIHHDAPESLLVGTISLLHDQLDKSPSWIRGMICGVRRVRPDPSNWSQYPNIWGEAQDLVYSAEWFEFYDFVEACADSLEQSEELDHFESAMNQLFEEEHIGWRLVDGVLEIQGDKLLEDLIEESHEELEATSFNVASQELREARTDLSRRPDPDLSGAVHHAMAALEAVARQVTGEPKKTLGDIIKRNPGLLPPPVDEAATKLWGFASEQGRHGSEGRTLKWAETMLVVGTAAALCSYLIAKQEEM